MSKRRHFKQQSPLEDRLAAFAKTARAVAALLPPGAEKDEMLRKALRADTMAGLQPRKATPCEGLSSGSRKASQ